MPIRMTPPISVVGRFTLREPYTISNTRLYTCKAIRSISELQHDYRRVFEEFYEPYGISKTRYEDDINANVHIVTLIATVRVGDGNDIIHVPDSFIASYPNDDIIPYHRVVFSVDMGLLPEILDVSHTQTALSNLASDVLGKAADVTIHLSEYEGIVSREDHDAQEASRLENVESKETDRAQYLEQVRINQDLRREIDALKRYIRENELLEG